MTEQEIKHLYNVFEPLLSLDNVSTHSDLINLYYNGIAYIKKNFNERSRDIKTIAMYYLKLKYDKNGLDESLLEKIINDFFAIYDKEFENYKSEFELISDEIYLLLSFAYVKS